MPGRRAHQVLGTTTGTLFAAYRSRNQRPMDWALETAGGALGGYIGSTLADVLEPAISSWHRGTAHSAATGAAILFSMSEIAKWEAFCRMRAEECTAMPMILTAAPQGAVFVAAQLSPLEQLLRTMAAIVWRVLAGVPAGLASSYMSHLALDAATPRSIPLLR